MWVLVVTRRHHPLVRLELGAAILRISDLPWSVGAGSGPGPALKLGIPGACRHRPQLAGEAGVDSVGSFAGGSNSPVSLLLHDSSFSADLL